MKVKGLRLCLPPFASDIAGASAVFYALGGLVLILDAGGCAGNVCADEPRWGALDSLTPQSPRLFSAGLRDMDAILGRDDLLVDKLEGALRELPAVGFVALIGTPAPAIIGTDYRALTRLAAKVTDKPIVYVASDGTRLYHEGASKAFLTLMQKFAAASAMSNDTIGVLGATPLDFTAERLSEICRELGADSAKVNVYAWDGRLSDFVPAANVIHNVVVSASGLSAARWLHEKFGTPCTINCPLTSTERTMLDGVAEIGRGRVLIVHEPVWASSAAKYVQKNGHNMDITTATWFATPDIDVDVVFSEEDEFIEHVYDGHYDVIIGDGVYRRAVPGFSGRWVDMKHPAVSGCGGLT